MSWLARLLGRGQSQTYQADWAYAEALSRRATVQCGICKKQTQDFVQVQNYAGQYEPVCSDCFHEHGWEDSDS